VITLPNNIGPGESWTEDQLNSWLRKMEKWHLVNKRYVVQNGEGDWEYWATSLGVFVLRLLELLAKLRILKEQT
jgi:hypothetical protein